MRLPTEERPSIVGSPAGPEPPFPIRVSGEVIKGFGRGSKELGIPTANIPIDGLSIGGHKDVDSGIYFGWAGLEEDDDDDDEEGSKQNSQRSESSLERHRATNTGLDGQSSSTSNSGGAGNSVNIGVRSEARQAQDNESAVAEQTNTDPSQAEPSVIKKERRTKFNVYPMVMSIGWNPFYKNTKRSIEVHLLQLFPRDFYGAQLNLLIMGFIRPEYDYVSREALIEDIRCDIDVAKNSLGRDGWHWRGKGRTAREEEEGEGKGKSVGEGVTVEKEEKDRDVDWILQRH